MCIFRYSGRTYIHLFPPVSSHITRSGRLGIRLGVSNTIAQTRTWELAVNQIFLLESFYSHYVYVL